jgi:exosortase
MPGTTNRRHVWLFVFLGLSLVTFYIPLKTLASLSFQDERYSHTILIPVISFSLLLFERHKIFEEPTYSVLIASLLLVLAGLIGIAGMSFRGPAQNDKLSVFMLALVLTWIAAFTGCYGTKAFRAGLFPLLFLSLMIPFPASVIDRSIFFLQRGSADLTYVLFRTFGMPVLWHGFNFVLPGVEIEIAKECSGIRSALAFLITGTLAGHIFLRSTWSKFTFALLMIPIAIFKNAVRIVILSSLGLYVDRGFLFGRLHHQGGLVFALIGLAMMLPLLWGLQKIDGGVVQEGS